MDRVEMKADTPKPAGKALDVPSPAQSLTSPVPNGSLETAKRLAIAGLGMCSNAYTMLAVGNIHPILEICDPDCWAPGGTACSDMLRNSVHSAVFVGVIFGMAIGGYFGDHFGRRRGLCLTAAVMLLGSMLVVSSNGASPQQVYTWYVVSLALFGVGVGGEYPISAVASAESAEHERLLRKQRMLADASHVTTEYKKQKGSRGAAVSLSFSMQGIGILGNSVVILILMYLFQQTDPSHYDRTRMSLIWRMQYWIGGLVVAGLLWYRVKFLEESDVWLLRKHHEEEGIASGSTERRHSPQLIRHFFATYWPRLIGTAGGWFVWDCINYGNKIFQSDFIQLFEVNPTITTTLKWTIVNATVSLVGYYVAAFTMDKLWMGRRRMQVMGFGVLGVTFLALGYYWGQLQNQLLLVQVLYYTTSFFGQWGPNATTWIFPSEVYPTEMRAIGHSVSALGGKLGALTATVAFTQLDVRVRFLWCGVCGVVGLLFTVAFLPEVMTMDLAENDEFWDNEKFWVRRSRPQSAVSSPQTTTTRTPLQRHYIGAFQQRLSLFEGFCSMGGVFVAA